MKTGGYQRSDVKARLKLEAEYSTSLLRGYTVKAAAKLRYLRTDSPSEVKAEIVYASSIPRRPPELNGINGGYQYRSVKTYQYRETSSSLIDTDDASCLVALTYKQNCQHFAVMF